VVHRTVDGLRKVVLEKWLGELGQIWVGIWWQFCVSGGQNDGQVRPLGSDLL